MKRDLRDPLIAQSIAIFCLVLALTGDFVGYFFLLRFIVCGLCAYLAVGAYQRSKQYSVWIYGALAVLYNPLIPIRLGRAVWSNVYLATIVLICFMLWLLVRSSKPPKQAAVQASQKEDALANFLAIYVDKRKHDEEAAIHDCKCCGRAKRTQMAVFMENVSYFFARSERRFEGYVCFPCMTMTFII